MSDFPECPKCFQSALCAESVDCDCYVECDCEPEEYLRCAACDHEPTGLRNAQTERLLEQATAAFVESRFTCVLDVRAHWRAKLKREREKVARLAEGRW